jgi:hypothetical protein
MLLSSGAGLPGQDAASIALCFPGTLDPARVAGKIVVCDRGQNARIEKSQAVADAGGVGMILVNTSSGTLNADIHSVPTVHLDYLSGIALKRLIASTPGLQARLTARIIVTGPAVPAPNVAADSSRGPALAGDGDLLKPDLLAPGVDILAAYTPLRTGHDFEFLRGSSMSSALIAGIAAVVRQAHPGWSPAAIKSALMTTAAPRRNDGGKIREEDENQDAANLFGIGSGLVQPTAALDPGLVYEANSADWLGFLCGTGQACFAPLGAIDPSDLNYPSIAVGAFVGQQTVSRTVTNVSPYTSRYSVSLQAPAGISIDVSPSSFTIAPGASQPFKVRFSRTGAALGHYAFGALTWSDGQHIVRSPIAILPRPLAAPAAVHGQAAPLQYSITFGYSGPFRAIARGLLPAITQRRAVLDDPANEINTALASGRGIVVIPIEVSEGSTYARFSLFDGDTDGIDNLDLYLFDAKREFVSRSAGDTSNEEVNLTNPAPGRYSAVVHGLETDGPDANFTLYSWVLGDTRAGNMSVTAPSQAALAKSAAVGLSFSQLEPGVRYLGSVAYSGARAMPNPTIVRIDR